MFVTFITHAFLFGKRADDISAFPFNNELKKIYKNYLIFLVKGVIIEKHLVSVAITMPRYGVRGSVC